MDLCARSLDFWGQAYLQVFSGRPDARQNTVRNNENKAPLVASAGHGRDWKLSRSTQANLASGM